MAVKGAILGDILGKLVQEIRVNKLSLKLRELGVDFPCLVYQEIVYID